MMSTLRSRTNSALSLLLVALAAQPSAAQTWGSAGVEVSTLPSGFSIVGYSSGLNEAGQLVGWSQNPAALQTEAAVFDENGVTFPGTGSFSIGEAINGAGEIAGVTRTSSGAPRAIFVDGISMTLLPTTGLGPYSEAFGINDAGHVVGYAWGGATYRPFLWDGASVFDLGDLGGGHNIAWALNDNGQVVGTSSTAAGYRRAFLYENGAMTDLGTLGGTSSEARSVNDAGQVVGYAYTASGAQRAFLFDGGTMTDLGTFGGLWSQSVALDINEAGQVVGRSTDDLGVFHAALWQDGQVFRLADLVGDGWSFSNAASITDSGFILAQGRQNGGTTQWVLLRENRVPTEVVPEPITMVLLGSGLVGVAGAARRRRRDDVQGSDA